MGIYLDQVGAVVEARDVADFSYLAVRNLPPNETRGGIYIGTNTRKYW